MGIDVYVRRDLETPTEPPKQDFAGAEPLAPAPSLMGVHAASAEAPPVGSAAHLHAQNRDATAAIAADAEQHAVPASDIPTAAAPREAVSETASPPRFRLLALRFGATLLLVDEMALPETRREIQQRLGDLVRTAGLLTNGALAPARALEVQTFFWPQIEAQHVDQSAPRAEEALLAWVTRCTEDGAGALIVVDAPPAAIPGDAVSPLAALETLPIRRARIDAGFLAPGDSAAQRAAWAALQTLAVAS